MRLNIYHETHYRFGEAAEHSTQYLRLTPRPDSCQHVCHWQLSTPGKVRSWTDGFGNFAHISVQDGKHDEVAVIVRGEVETLDTAGIVPPDDGLPPLMFLRETRLTAVNEPLRALAEPFRERIEDEGAIAALHAVMMKLMDVIEYRSGHTDADSTAAEALDHGYGVCQDLAHIFIACCRCLGIPARYVSGYLFDDGNTIGSVASHAWAEAYIDDLGWISFDPTNGISATESYVRLAVALDYDGASPIRGVRRGGGMEDMTVRIEVVNE
ncbi:MAG: transglutaminase family protein [Rhodospirillales bacterium]|nr:transglutaminase family protein [Rhodospirillales bacterium]